MMWPFYLMALVAIVSTVRVVTNANPVHALLSLIVSLLAVAGMFLIVGAPFAGALEVIVYAGGTEMVGPKAVGQALFTQYLLLVEVAAMLLLAALVAAFHLGKREPDAEEEKE